MSVLLQVLAQSQLRLCVRRLCWALVHPTCRSWRLYRWQVMLLASSVSGQHVASLTVCTNGEE